MKIKNQGDETNNKEVPLSQIADDTWLCLDGSEEILVFMFCFCFWKLYKSFVCVAAARQ